MNKRLLELRKTLNLTQEQFGMKLGIKKAAISKLEKGENNLTESNKKLICKVFSVNIKWLENGEGDMFIHDTDDNELEVLFNDIYNEENEFKKKLFLVLAKLNDTQWELLEEIANNLLQVKIQDDKVSNNLLKGNVISFPKSMSNNEDEILSKNFNTNSEQVDIQHLPDDVKQLIYMAIGKSISDNLGEFLNFKKNQ